MGEAIFSATYIRQMYIPTILGLGARKRARRKKAYASRQLLICNIELASHNRLA